MINQYLTGNINQLRTATGYGSNEYTSDPDIGYRSTHPTFRQCNFPLEQINYFPLQKEIIAFNNKLFPSLLSAPSRFPVCSFQSSTYNWNRHPYRRTERPGLIGPIRSIARCFSLIWFAARLLAWLHYQLLEENVPIKNKFSTGKIPAVVNN